MATTNYPGIYTYTKQGRKLFEVYASHGGKQRHSRGFTSLDGAKSWQRETLAAMKSGQVGTAKATYTFGDYFTNRWLPFKEEALAAGSLRTYRSLGKRIESKFNKARLTSITALDIQDFLTRLNKDGLTPASRRVIFAILHSALDDARRWKLLGYNPAQDVTPPVPESRVPPQLAREGISALLEAAAGTSYLMVVYLAITTGMRYGEIAALEWGHIDFARAELRVPRAKTKSGVRDIALDSEMLETLQGLYQAQMKLHQDAAIRRVFLSPRGLTLDRAGFRKTWLKITKEAGLEGLHFHDLRHAHATMLARAGIHPAVTRQRLGHSRSSFTLDVYTHVEVEDQRAAAEVVRDILKERE